MVTVKRSACRLTWQLMFRGKVIHVEHTKEKAERMANELNNKFGPLIS